MHNSRKAFLAALLILLVAGFFRFWNLTQTPPGLYPDEAMNGNNALFALRTGNFDVFYPQNNGREGLFINIQALALGLLGNEPWVLRAISAVFGTLTVLSLFYFGRELFRGMGGAKMAGFYPNEIVALSASFFTAASFWHINFSRVGFRAIMAPFFLVWGLYFLWLIFRKDFSESKKFWVSVLGGIFFGLGAHSYIAYRVAPVLLLIPLFKIIKNRSGYKNLAVFLAAALIVFMPLGIYYSQNPADFLGRTSQVSIFSDANPLKSFSANIFKTIGAFWFSGDWNPRHNLPGAPLLWWPVGILFALGLVFSVTKHRERNFTKLLWLWLAIFALPVVFSSEGLPHALRSILMLPAIMFFSGLGFWELLLSANSWREKQLAGFPEQTRQIRRIGFEFTILVAALFSAHLIITYTGYFIRWSGSPDVGSAFASKYAEIGRWMALQPDEVTKYVVINASGVLVPSPDDQNAKPLPMPAQSIMFFTDTWSGDNQIKRNITYLLPDELEQIECPDSCVILPIESDPGLVAKIKNK